MKVKEATNGRLTATAIGGECPTNGALETVEYSMPYVVNVTIQGTSDFLYHKWNCEDIEAKAKAPKGSKAKKTDNPETFVYRNEEGYLCIPGDYLRGSIINAAKYKQDPRSPRKSAMDLFKAGVVSLTNLSSTGHKEWDYIDRRRVTIQRNGITRERPALRAGWKADFQLQVNLPEYISPELLHEIVAAAGRLVGVGDYRPTYGRFMVTNFEIGLE